MIEEAMKTACIYIVVVLVIVIEEKIIIIDIAKDEKRKAYA